MKGIASIDGPSEIIKENPIYMMVGEDAKARSMSWLRLRKALFRPIIGGKLDGGSVLCFPFFYRFSGAMSGRDRGLWWF